MIRICTQFRHLIWVIAWIVSSPADARMAPAAEVWSNGNHAVPVTLSAWQTARPSPLQTAWQNPAPYGADPRTSGPQQPMPAIDYVESPPLGEPFGADEWSDPLSALPLGPPPLWSQSYEYDSYEGTPLPQPFASGWCAFTWFCPFAHTNATWIQGQGDSLGIVEFDRQLLFTNELIAPLRIIPGFSLNYMSGPNVSDLPPRLYEASLEVAGTYQLQNSWVLDVGLRPMLNGDFKYVNSDTFRLQGHAVASRPISQETQGVFGFIYLAREDISVLPVAGVVWQPNPDVKWELIFPKPKLAVRVGGFTDNGWLYLRSELGGNSWSIERANGHRDVATYRDIRLIAGYEAILPEGFAAQFEAGWVFSRKLTYASDFSDVNPRDTFLIQAGLSF